ncbi:short-chain dehydrogenase/reductase SDR [Novosphingobium sp. Rr 2-17]|nr:short-chain dehydrogenase/reductase SDR [Novosphingobium sp. Rr 2-17]
MKRARNTIFITGGNSGIGRALAHRWHDLGNRVIVAGRRRSALEETVAGHPGMTFYELDVADPDAITAVTRRLVAEHPDLNVLVNCAGISGAEDPTVARDLSRGEQMVETNLLGPIRMIDALVDHLKGRPAAAIVTVSSGTGFVPYPAAPTYSASKAALHSYTLSLRALLRDALQVIEIIPPQVATDLMEGLKDSPYSVPLEKFADDVMAQLISHPSADEIIVDEVKPFRFAERDGTVRDLLKAMAADAGQTK